MGKIKTRLIIRTANNLLSKGVVFTGKFEYNKKVLGNTIQSMKIRNQVAGFLARVMSKRRKTSENIQIAAKI